MQYGNSFTSKVFMMQYNNDISLSIQHFNNILKTAPASKQRYFFFELSTSNRLLLKACEKVASDLGLFCLFYLFLLLGGGGGVHRRTLYPPSLWYCCYVNLEQRSWALSITCDAIGLWADWDHYGNKFFFTFSVHILCLVIILLHSS